jgi:hypothetical protein
VCRVISVPIAQPQIVINTIINNTPEQRSSMTTANSAPINLSADDHHGTATSSTTEQLADLWTKAVDRYVDEARLKENEKASLKKRNSPDELLTFTQYGWDENIIDKRWKYHTMAQQTVGQIIGIFDILDVALGMAAVVLSKLQVMAYSCLQSFPPVSVLSGAMKLFLQVNPFLSKYNSEMVRTRRTFGMYMT